jgi:hypothetical protein
VGGAEPSTEAASADAIPERTTGDPIDISVFAPTGNRAEDIAAVRNQGLAVDDDNEPAPENISDANTQSINITQPKEGQTWGWDGIDRRVVAGANNSKPTFKDGWSPMGKTFLEVF